MTAPVSAGKFPVETLLVDARPVDHPTARQRGIGRYVTGLLRGLHEIDVDLVALYATDIEAEVLDDAIAGLALARWSPQTVRPYAVPGTWYVATQLMLHPIPLDPIPSLITSTRLPVAAVMYDVIPYRFPERYQVELTARHQARLRAPLARTADALLAISEFAAETAAAELHYPLERIAMIGAGVEEQFVTPEVDRRARPDRILPPEVTRYVVSVTGGDERKNTEGLLRAWGLVDPDIRRGRHLVVATAHSPEVLRRWQGWATEAGVLDEVVFTGSVTDDEMVAVLQGAELAVMPSTEEGFGLPVVEAAACGTPVICSNVSSLPEVLADPIAEFDPFDPSAIARAIERALVDDDHRDRLRAAGIRAAQRWQWTNVARDTVDALSRLGPRWPMRVRPPTPRLAFLGPGAGSDSGIGTYDERVLDALWRRSDDVQIDVYVDGSASAVPTNQHDGAAQRAPVRAFDRYAQPWNYDDVVAVLGSSPHHIATAHLAARVPAHLWMHEASLVGVHVGLAHASGSHPWAIDYMRAVLERAEPWFPETRALGTTVAVSDDMLLDAPLLDERGVTLLGEVVGTARSVIVSSERAAATVRRTSPDGPPILVLPLAFPPVAERPEPPASGDIVAVGWLAANKAPQLTVEAFARLREHGSATLTFVGPSVPEAVEQVTIAAAGAGLRDRVFFTGRLDDHAFRARLARARVGLQLRTQDRGEMSAAIADLLALGIPTVTTLRTALPSSPGVQVVDADVAAVTAAIMPLLDDDAVWAAASQDAIDRAASWTFDDVAAALVEWVADVDELPPGTIRRCGPRADPNR